MRPNPSKSAAAPRATNLRTRLQSFSTAQQIALAAPPVVICSMYGVFHYLTTLLGFPLGYLIAFVVYWIGWCGALPAALLGPRRMLDLLAPRAPFSSLDLRTRTLLLWPIVFPLAFAFVPRVARAGAAVLVVSVILGLVIGVTEEILWRGVYASLFGSNAWLASIYPSIGFGVWHLCPLSVLPSRYPAVSCPLPRTPSSSACHTLTTRVVPVPSSGARSHIACTMRSDSAASSTRAGLHSTSMAER